MAGIWDDSVYGRYDFEEQLSFEERMKLVMIEHQGFTNIKGRVDAWVEVESLNKEDAEWKRECLAGA